MRPGETFRPNTIRVRRWLGAQISRKPSGRTYAVQRSLEPDFTANPESNPKSEQGPLEEAVAEWDTLSFR